MTKRKRYQLTEQQLKPVVNFITENYPAGVTGHNIDQLSGANRNMYTTISDVTLDEKTDELVFDVETSNGHGTTKSVWTGDDNLIMKVEERLLQKKYDLEAHPEWKIKAAFVKYPDVILNISPLVNEHEVYQISITIDEILSILPEIGDEEYGPDRSGWDEVYDERGEM